MARNNDAGKIYSATYSNVPVYELNCENNHVMRRRSDDWINATHILKVADYDKPARTRILEREVQKGVHEKVQGGYGKYQGTWIPLQDGRELAAKNGVFEKLRPIFEYVPGDRSPPPAPKHATAVSSKPRVPRAPAPPRRQPAYQPMHGDYGDMDTSMRDDETPDNVTVVSESLYDDYDTSQYTNSRKRRRVEDPMSQADKEHQLWADELLDYFLLADNPLDAMPTAPVPPPNANLDRPIDEKGHTALHWAAAMGDMEVVKDLIRRGASIEAQAKNGETPLMRSVIFTNCFDRNNMDRLASLLIRTVNMQEWLGSTVFHHIANATQRKSKYACARYYIDTLLNKMSEILSPDSIERILNHQDSNGDTAITIAARYGARKCVRSLLGRNAAVDLRNRNGETADQLIVLLNQRRQERVNNRQLSSSPFQPDGPHNSHNSNLGGPVQPPNFHPNLPFDPLLAPNPSSSHSLLNGTTTSSALTNGQTPSDVYKSEAALTLTSQILPVLFTKAQTLASSIDAEIAEKDAELAEAERVAAMRRAELEALRRQQEEIRVREGELKRLGNGEGEEGDGGGGGGGGVEGEEDELLAKELRDLEKECEDLERRERSWELEEIYRKKKLRHDDDDDADGEEDEQMAENDDEEQEGEEEKVIRTQFRLAHQLLSLRHERIELIKSIVQNLSMAGVASGASSGGGSSGGGRDGNGSKQEQFKQLITGALGVREEDVEGLLPEIVSELEEFRAMEGLVGAA